MKIEGKELTPDHFLSPITYVPNHAKGNPGHKDCKLGLLYKYNNIQGTIKMINCESRTVQSVDSRNLVWG